MPLEVCLRQLTRSQRPAPIVYGLIDEKTACPCHSARLFATIIIIIVEVSSTSHLRSSMSIHASLDAATRCLFATGRPLIT